MPKAFLAIILPFIVGLSAIIVIVVIGVISARKLEKKILEAEKNMQQAAGFEKPVQENTQNPQ